jgi:hypothetical protein
MRPLQYFDFITSMTTEDKQVFATSALFQVIRDNIEQTIDVFMYISRAKNERDVKLGGRGKHRSFVPVKKQKTLWVLKEIKCVAYRTLTV